MQVKVNFMSSLSVQQNNKVKKCNLTSAYRSASWRAAVGLPPVRCGFMKSKDCLSAAETHRDDANLCAATCDVSLLSEPRKRSA